MPSIAIIGSGAIGEKHAEAAAAAGFKITWCIDTDTERAAELAQKHGARHAATPEPAFEDRETDAVVISAPNKFHRPLAEQAMRAGKDVLLEKPMGRTAAECDPLLDLAEQTGRVLQICFIHRFTSVVQAAKQLVDAGELGEVYHAKAQMCLRRGVPGLGRWFTNKEQAGGGVMIDLGVHLVDLMLHLLGQPTPTAVLGKTYSKFGAKMRGYTFESMWAGPPNYDGVCNVDDSAHAMITFADGCSLTIDACWAGNFPDGQAPPSRVALLGSDAGVTFELSGDHLNVARVQHGRLTDTRVSTPAGKQMVEQMHGFAEAIAARRPTIGASGADGRKVQSLIDAVYASSESNLPVTL